MQRLILCLAMPLVALIPPAASAITWHVPGDAETIQDGIDLAAEGDTVLVACGTYYEHDIAMRTGVCLRSVTGLPDCVTIDAQRLGRVMRCDGADSETVLQGLTFTNGFASFRGQDGDTYMGGGLYLVDSFDGPQVSACVFLENESVSYGGGVHCGTRGEPVFRRCEFIRNSCINSGAGVYATLGLGLQCSPTFEECLFEGNDAPASGGGCSVYANSSTFVEIADCDFIGNEAANGGGVNCIHGHLTVNGCLFVGNSTTAYIGGAIRVYECASVEIASCTMVGNQALSGSGVHAAGCAIDVDRTIVAFGEGSYGQGGEGISCSSGAEASVSCSDVYGNASGDWVDCIEDQYGINGNISEDPLFCDPESGDFTLQDCSPCAPFTPPNPECDLIGARPVGCGGSPAIKTSWGGVKALFRE